jgi:hypothetical protein
MWDETVIRLGALANRCHVDSEPGTIEFYRYAELGADRALAYGFGNRNAYAYAGFLNINFALPPQLRAESNVLHAAVDKLRELQDEDSGYFIESSHHPLHTTACALAALARFETKPKRKVRALQQFLKWSELEQVLNRVRWEINPWRDSNIPSGIVTSLALTEPGIAFDSLLEAFFAWLTENIDPERGLWRKGAIVALPDRGHFPNIASAFHFMFLYEFFKKDIPYGKRLNESCISFIQKSEFVREFHRGPGFLEIDWLYCFSRTLKYNSDFPAALEILTSFEIKYIKGLSSWLSSSHSSDLHALSGCFSALSEIQKSLTAYRALDQGIQLRQVLDRYPFI